MNTPTLTIEAITYNGNNSSEIMIWVQQGHKCYTDRKGRLHVDTIKGNKILKEGHTVVRVGFDMFSVIYHPVATIKN